MSSTPAQPASPVPAQETAAAPLTEWLQVMTDEVTRKGEAERQAQAEAARRGQTSR